MRNVARGAVPVLVLAATTAAAQQWSNVTPAAGPAPTPRYLSAAVYDPVGRRMIVLGGATATSEVADVWAFDLASHQWTNLTPFVGPAPEGRLTPNAIYDPVGHQVLFWSGQKAGTFFNDVWAFDLDTETWSEFQPPDPDPNPRYGTASIFDPVRRDLVAFAGFTDAGRFEDTWRFDLDDDEWTEVTPAAGPGRRCLHSASHDIRGQRMIVYGGQRTGALGDVWGLDLTGDAWTNLTPASSPPARFFTAHAYDSIRHRALIFGGNRSPGLSDETWSFDLASRSWQLLQPAVRPSAREGAAGIYVVNEDRMIVFGGRNGSVVNNEVWSLDFSGGAPIAFPDPVRAGADGFRWTVPANVDVIRGDLAEVSTYGFEVYEAVTHAAAYEDPEIPAPGTGWYYLFRLRGPQGTWQTAAGAEPLRDLLLP